MKVEQDVADQLKADAKALDLDLSVALRVRVRELAADLRAEIEGRADVDA